MRSDSLHLGDLGQAVAFIVGLALGRLQLFGALPHRGAFLGREARGRLARGARGRLLCVRHGGCPLTLYLMCHTGRVRAGHYYDREQRGNVTDEGGRA